MFGVSVATWSLAPSSRLLPLFRRYFYDNGDMPHSLSFAQVREIQKASWARILCDNVENVNVMQPLAFYVPNPLFNGVRHCQSFAIPTVNLRVF